MTVYTIFKSYMIYPSYSFQLQIYKYFPMLLIISNQNKKPQKGEPKSAVNYNYS